MKTLHRNKRKIYVCEAYADGHIRKFKEPVELKENWSITNNPITFVNIGLDSYEYVRIRTSVNHAKYYHLGDRAYIQVKPPEEHDVLCKTADFEVCKDPVPSINECEILLKRLSGRNNDSIF